MQTLTFAQYFFFLNLHHYRFLLEIIIILGVLTFHWVVRVEFSMLLSIDNIFHHFFSMPKYS